MGFGVCRRMFVMVHTFALATSMFSSSMFASSMVAPSGFVAPTGPTISSEALRVDLKVLKEALTTIHAGLYRYQSQAELEKGFKDLEGRFSKGATQAEVFLALSEFTAKIKCGHTFPSFWNNPIQTQRNLFTAQDRLPINFRWMEGKMVVTRNDSSNPSIQRGELITEINGVKTEVVLARLLKLVKGDGSNDAKRIVELELQDLKEWEAFDIYYGLAFKPTNVYSLTIESLDGKVRKEQVEAIDYKQRRKNRAEHSAPVQKDGPEWQFTWVRPDTAKFSMPTWALYNSKWDWKLWLHDRFVELKEKGAKNILLDVRGNAGGNECGDEFMRYLVPSKVSFPSGKTFVRYQKIPSTLALYVSTWDRAFYDWSFQSKNAVAVQELNSQAFQIRDEDSVNAERGGVIEPLEPRFAGKVFVLVDAECSSATFQFAQQVRNYKVGTLVGQPTGGNCRGINGGAIFFTTLPNSQVEIDLPIIAYLPATAQPDAGLTPDVTIRDTRNDIVEGRDAVMDWVMKQIEAGSALGKESRR